MAKTKTLWSDLPRTRHFLIPDGQELPPGDFVLHTVTGRQQQVEAEAMAPFEVTQEEAKAWLKGQFGQIIDKAKGAVLEALRQGQARPADFDVQPEEESTSGKPSPVPPSSSPGLTLLSALSGEPMETLRTDPKSVSRAIRGVLAELGGIFDDATAPEEARVEVARGRVRSLRMTLLQHGLPVSDKLEDLPDRIREAFRSAERREDLQNISAGLEALAEGLEQAGVMAAERLRTLAQRLRESKGGPEAPAKSGNEE